MSEPTPKPAESSDGEASMTFEPAWLAEVAKAAQHSLNRTQSLQSSKTTMAEMPPVVPDYEIVSLLGAGGMSRVWLAKSKDTQQQVALKVLRGVRAEDATARDRFEQEADLLASMDHPNIVSLLDAGETDDGQFFLALEYIEGCDLRRLLKAGRLPMEHALSIFLKVCSALEYAHERGVVHRDLKPANILIAKNASVVKVADFGLAKASRSTLTIQADAFGTPYYVAPEGMVNAAAAAPTTDVYALGVLLYEMLSGRIPVGSYTPLSNQGCHKLFDHIVTHALRDDPAKRTTDVRSLRLAVEKAWGLQQRQLARKRFWPWLTAAALALCGVIVGLFYGRSSHGRSMAAKESFVPAARASREKPWENSLGMKFVPVLGTDVLFSIWEVRVQDWQHYLKAQSEAPVWMFDPESGERFWSKSMVTVMRPEGWVTAPQEAYEEKELWTRPDLPAAGLNWMDGRLFAAWLTWKEQAEGRLQKNEHYRMPLPSEWQKAANRLEVETGNFAGPDSRTASWPQSWPTTSVPDGYPLTSPVGSFPPSLDGVYDLAGNVAEWMQEEGPRVTSQARRNFSRALRGGSWVEGAPETANVRNRIVRGIRRGRADTGLRIVLDFKHPASAASIKGSEPEPMEEASETE